MTYTQCQFALGNKRTFCWIETWAAKVGNRVQLLDMEGCDGAEFWKVIERYSTLPKDYVLEHARDYKERQGSLRGGGIDEKGRK